MLGTLVNSASIVIAALIGLFFNSGISESYKKTLMQGISLAIILIGLKNALLSDDIIVIILSLVSGSLIGEFFAIEKKLNDLAFFVEKKFFYKEGKDLSIAKAFVSSSLVFCIGSMAIIGSIEAALSDSYHTLFAKSALDFVAALIFSASMGIGVLFSAFSVLLYQGSITLFASLLKPFLLDEVLRQMSGVGGLLILATGFNLLGLSSIAIANLLPAIFIPLFIYILKFLFL